MLHLIFKIFTIQGFPSGIVLAESKFGELLYASPLIEIQRTFAT